MAASQLARLEELLVKRLLARDKSQRGEDMQLIGQMVEEK
jgi:hypothetical protein